MTSSGSIVFAFFGPSEMVVIAVVAVLLFGKNLPQVARQAGRAMAELKKGMAGLQSELTSAIHSDSPSSYRPSSSSTYRDDDDRDEPTAPKFEPPPSEPVVGQIAAAGPQVELAANSAATGAANAASPNAPSQV